MPATSTATCSPQSCSKAAGTIQSPRSSASALGSLQSCTCLSSTETDDQALEQNSLDQKAQQIVPRLHSAASSAPSLCSGCGVLRACSVSSSAGAACARSWRSEPAFTAASSVKRSAARPNLSLLAVTLASLCC